MTVAGIEYRSPQGPPSSHGIPDKCFLITVFSRRFRTGVNFRSLRAQRYAYMEHEKRNTYSLCYRYVAYYVFKYAFLTEYVDRNCVNASHAAVPEYVSGAATHANAARRHCPDINREFVAEKIIQMISLRHYSLKNTIIKHTALVWADKTTSIFAKC